MQGESLTSAVFTVTQFTGRLEKERNPSTEAVEDRLRKRKRRVLTARGPDSGKEAQDMRIPDESNYKTKKVSDNNSTHGYTD